MVKAEHFAIQELVPQHVYEQRGEKAWQLLDDRAVMTLDQLRKAYGPIYVNTWHLSRQPFGQIFNWSGLRTLKYYANVDRYDASFSQHKYGRAFDCKFMEADVDKIRQDILGNEELFPFIMSVELNTSWLHFDTRNCERVLTYPIPLGK